jgi:hypothetical protein
MQSSSSSMRHGVWYKNIKELKTLSKSLGFKGYSKYKTKLALQEAVAAFLDTPPNERPQQHQPDIVKPPCAKSYQERNAQGRCVGRKPREDKKQLPCAKSYQERNAQGRCVGRKPTECKSDKVRDFQTGRCVKPNFDDDDRPFFEKKADRLAALSSKPCSKPYQHREQGKCVGRVPCAPHQQRNAAGRCIGRKPANQAPEVAVPPPSEGKYANSDDDSDEDSGEDSLHPYPYDYQPLSGGETTDSEENDATEEEQEEAKEEEQEEAEEEEEPVAHRTRSSTN